MNYIFPLSYDLCAVLFPFSLHFSLAKHFGYVSPFGAFFLMVTAMASGSCLLSLGLAVKQQFDSFSFSAAIFVQRSVSN